jgi:DNA-binding NtrC family response regulator
VPEQVRQALPAFELSLSPASSVVKDAATPVATGGSISLLHSDNNLSLRERVENYERQLLLQAFQEVKGNVSEMARRLRTDRANLHRKLQRYNIK